MRRGDIYIFDLTYGRLGSEQDKIRPAVIVSHDEMNQNSSWSTVIIVPLSTSQRQMRRRDVLVIPRGAGGLTADSVAMFHQVTTIDRQRLRTHIGTLDTATMEQVDKGLSMVLALS